uniref:Membrane protein n=1 Tax=Pantoea phage Survivor TaxID=3232176 RepID=A0AAU8KZQ5_9CAUD
MIEDFKETLTFKGGIFIGLMMWICVLMLVALLGALCYAPFEAAETHREMEAQHCVKTDESRVTHGTILMPVGKVMVPMPNTSTEYKYDCDDGIRWR